MSYTHTDGEIGRPDGTFSFSLDQETYEGSYPTREDALADGLQGSAENSQPGDRVPSIWTGENRTFVASDFVPPGAGSLLERLAEEAYEVGGEFAEDWLANITNDPRRRLDRRNVAESDEDFTARVQTWKETEQAKETELHESVKALVDAWATRHGEHPRFYHVAAIVQHDFDLVATEDGTEPAPGLIPEPPSDG